MEQLSQLADRRSRQSRGESLLELVDAQATRGAMKTESVGDRFPLYVGGPNRAASGRAGRTELGHAVWRRIAHDHRKVADRSSNGMRSAA